MKAKTLVALGIIKSIIAMVVFIAAYQINTEGSFALIFWNIVFLSTFIMVLADLKNEEKK